MVGCVGIDSSYKFQEKGDQARDAGLLISIGDSLAYVNTRINLVKLECVVYVGILSWLWHYL